MAARTRSTQGSTSFYTQRQRSASGYGQVQGEWIDITGELMVGQDAIDQDESGQHEGPLIVRDDCSKKPCMRHALESRTGSE